MAPESDTEAAVPGPGCWWCGAPADSREHKFKKSELRLNNGPGPWRGEAKPASSIEAATSNSG